MEESQTDLITAPSQLTVADTATLTATQLLTSRLASSTQSAQTATETHTKLAS